MSELRKDPTSNSWVVIASERGKRPHDFNIPPVEKKATTCPFCYGNESQTPPEVLALGRETGGANEPGWKVRVVPNKFPALSPHAAGHNAGHDVEPEHGELYVHSPGIGAHEVLIESPDHDGTFGTHSQEQMETILKAVILRFMELHRDDRLKYPQFFKNSGRIAGASLEHTHCQLIATPSIPAVVREELNATREFYEHEGKCVFCAMVEDELARGRRVVAETGHSLIFCPYASRFPYETWIVPKKHIARFEETPDEIIRDIAHGLRTTFAKLERAFIFLPYNLVLHTAPWGDMNGTSFHWHIEILPRLTIIAGFELGTGYYINPTAPELAAPTIRDA
ncbi:MAG TPA: galactose-1-phosphate uridylyltransferase [Firmicutes bacterium]|nr:galactose-1-phosphate uridylyltransferase [Bacillota bacterium]